MTNNLPKNWEPTEGEEIVPVKSAHTKDATQNTQVHTVSRKPAAIVGILVVILAGISFFYGLDNLVGQLETEENKIVINESGISPLTVYAKPGDTIEWINEQDIPHYLVSDTLCDANGECMSTTTMFPDMEVSYDIPYSVIPGIYTYYSPTDTTLEGTIIIENSLGNQTSSYSSSIDTQIPEEEEEYEPEVINPQSQLFTSSSSSASVPNTATGSSAIKSPLLESIEKQLELDKKGTNTIPVNSPYNAQTVTTGTNAVPGVPQNPYAMQQNAQSYVPAAGTENSFANSVQKPFTQPNTGAGSWISITLILISIVLIVLNSRKREVLYK
jgi:plastocyanin